MRMQDIRPERIDRGIDTPGERRDAGELADHPRAERVARPVEGQPVDRFDRIRRRTTMPRSGYRRDLPSPRLLRFQDRAGAKRVTALQRQTMVEDVKDAHAVPCHGGA